MSPYYAKDSTLWSGFKKMLSLATSAESKLSLDLLRQLNQLACEGCQATPGIRCNSANIRLLSIEDEPSSNCTVAGTQELQNEWVKHTRHLGLYGRGFIERLSAKKAIDSLEKGHPVHLGFLPGKPKRMRKQMQLAIEHFNYNIELANSELETVYAIARFLHHLNLLQPFAHRNKESIIVLLGSWLLIKHGFFPIAYRTMNVFDAYSSFELADMMVRRLNKTSQAHGFYFDGEGLSSALQTLYDEYGDINLGEKLLVHYYRPYKSPQAKNNHPMTFKPKL